MQIENFNTGGQGLAYNDLDTANQGGQYRTSEGVDIEASTDTGGGYDVGWTAAGEWMNYTVNVTTAGTYTINTRVASLGPGGTFHYNVDGVSATSEVTVVDTGGWANFMTLGTPITLTAGTHVIQLHMDANGATGEIGRAHV